MASVKSGKAKIEELRSKKNLFLEILISTLFLPPCNKCCLSHTLCSYHIQFYRRFTKHTEKYGSFSQRWYGQVAWKAEAKEEAII